MYSSIRHSSDDTSDRTSQPQPPLGEDLLTTEAVMAGELRASETVELRASEEITQEYIERISTRDPSEDEATYRLRIRYTQAILNLPLRDDQAITLEEAIPLGFMVMKKTRYGITYSAPIEKRIQVINQLLLDSIRRPQTSVSTEPQSQIMPESQTP